jgi:hypothetical protein
MVPDKAACTPKPENSALMQRRCRRAVPSGRLIYFGLNELMVVLPIRNYFIFTVNYEDLKKCMKIDNPLWQEVLRIDISK